MKVVVSKNKSLWNQRTKLARSTLCWLFITYRTLVVNSALSLILATVPSTTRVHPLCSIYHVTLKSFSTAPKRHFSFSQWILHPGFLSFLLMTSHSCADDLPAYQNWKQQRTRQNSQTQTTVFVVTRGKGGRERCRKGFRGSNIR